MVGIFAPLSVPEFWVGGFGTGVAAGVFGLGDGGAAKNVPILWKERENIYLYRPFFFPEARRFRRRVRRPGPCSLTD